MTRHLTIERAQGRWPEILSRCGIDGSFLRNRHGPCPCCGGRDRFRFDDLDGSGSYFCNNCGASKGAGAGIRLLMKFRGWDFATACREIDGIVGDCRGAATKPHLNTLRSKTREAHALLKGATDARIVDSYLRRRGLSVSSAVLLGHPACPHYNVEKALDGHFPAVLAPIRDINGVLRGIHRIYIADVLPRKKTLLASEKIVGCSVQLHEHVDQLGIAEGVETALACFDLFGIPTWAALSDTLLQGFEPPPGLQHLTIFGDHDQNNAGQIAAYKLADRLRRSIKIEVKIPLQPGQDWLDVLSGGGKRRRSRIGPPPGSTTSLLKAGSSGKRPSCSPVRSGASSASTPSGLSTSSSSNGSRPEVSRTATSRLHTKSSGDSVSMVIMRPMRSGKPNQPASSKSVVAVFESQIDTP
jgi:putative DNA primase/helicase